MDKTRKCMIMKKFSLLRHQKRVVNFILNHNNRGLLVYHTVGSGKTMTALASAKCLIEKYPNRKVIIVTPASLVSNFVKEMKKTGISFSDRVVIESYNIFMKKKPSVCSGSILILDESHNLNAEGGVTFKNVFECSKNAFKVI